MHRDFSRVGIGAHPEPIFGALEELLHDRLLGFHGQIAPQ